MPCRTTAPTSLMALCRAQQWPGGRRRGMKHSRVKARCRGGTEGSSVVGVVVAGAKSSRVVCCLSHVSCTSAQEQRVYSSSEGSLGIFPLLTLQWVQQNVNSLLLPPCFGVAGEALKVSAGKGLLQKPFFSQIAPPSSCPKQTVLGAWRHCWAILSFRCVDALVFLLLDLSVSLCLTPLVKKKEKALLPLSTTEI